MRLMFFNADAGRAFIPIFFFRGTLQKSKELASDSILLSEVIRVEVQP